MDKQIKVDLMGNKNMPQNMQTVRIKNNISGQIEEMVVPMEADIIACDPSLQQIKDDADLLKVPGDFYQRTTKGSIISSDGETKIAVDLLITRKRNANGGIDVDCQVPCLAMTPEMTMGKPG